MQTTAFSTCWMQRTAVGRGVYGASPAGRTKHENASVFLKLVMEAIAVAKQLSKATFRIAPAGKSSKSLLAFLATPKVRAANPGLIQVQSVAEQSRLSFQFKDGSSLDVADADTLDCAALKEKVVAKARELQLKEDV